MFGGKTWFNDMTAAGQQPVGKIQHRTGKSGARNVQYRHLPQISIQGKQVGRAALATLLASTRHHHITVPHELVNDTIQRGRGVATHFQQTWARHSLHGVNGAQYLFALGIIHG